jgi:hypothetical protein
VVVEKYVMIFGNDLPWYPKPTTTTETTTNHDDFLRWCVNKIGPCVCGVNKICCSVGDCTINFVEPSPPTTTKTTTVITTNHDDFLRWCVCGVNQICCSAEECTTNFDQTTTPY